MGKNFWTSLMFIFVTSFFLGKASASGETIDGRFHSYARLLASTEVQDVRVAVIAIAKDRDFNVQLLDYVAELISSGRLSVNSKIDVDTVAWGVKALARVPERYQLVAERVRERYQKNRKLKNLVDEVFPESANMANEQQYLVGALVFDELRSKLQPPSLESKSLTENHGFSFTDSTIESLHEQLGLPDFVDSYERKVRLGGITFAAPRFIEMVWKRHGVVRFSFDEEADNSWVVNHAYSFVLDIDVDISAQLGVLGYSLLANDPDKLLRAAERVINTKNITPEIAELAAERLVKTRSTTNATDVNAHQLLCKILYMSKDSRFNLILKQIAESAAEEDLRKYAEKILKRMPSASKEPYEIKQSS